MRTPATPHPQFMGDELCWTVDWCVYFECRQVLWDRRALGDLPGFHVVFTIEIVETGRLRFWCDDGCIIRRSGRILHEDRRAHMVEPSELPVEAGDILEIAQWQLTGGWIWGAHVIRGGETLGYDRAQSLLPYLPAVRARLTQPNGPAVKMYTNGGSALRAVVTLYSLILNGYSPNGVYLFGEHQWSPASRELFARCLPFATVVSTSDLLGTLQRIPAPALATIARAHWFAMKACVALFALPHPSCMIDDDVFVLDSVDDALEAFQENELVYMQDQDLEGDYSRTWASIFGCPRPLRTRRFNAGLFWIRDVPNPRLVAARAIRVRVDPWRPCDWEQGLIAATFAQRPTLELPAQRYLFAVFTGLPCGALGYDYAANPCGFASVHFAGMLNKPTDADTLALIPQILHRVPALAIAV